MCVIFDICYLKRNGWIWIIFNKHGAAKLVCFAKKKNKGCAMSFVDEDHLSAHETKHEMMLNLSLSGQKYGNIFAADQTPTPTRLIKNCEEVGLFDDLRHVNPFDETFRRAVEQKNGQASPNSQLDGSINRVRTEESSLHTPQVFPHLEVNDTISLRNCESLQKVADSPGVEIVEQIIMAEATTQDKVCEIFAARQNSTSGSSSWNWGGGGKLSRYRSIAEKPVEQQSQNNGNMSTNVLPMSMQLLQPQVITLSFASSESIPPSTVSNNANYKDQISNSNNSNRKMASGIAAAIPVQTVKPFILPKLAPLPASAVEHCVAVPQSTVQPTTTAATTTSLEPSSASLTPTSQLPIKERLKVILSNSSKSRIIELPQKTNTRRVRNGLATNGKSTSKDGELDLIERRRAASSRYRIKMRSVHENLHRRNLELQGENDKLKQRVKQLEAELEKQKMIPQYVVNEANNHQPLASCTPAQIQIPPSTVHLVMNIPQFIIPSSGQPIMKNPVTFSVENK